MKTYLPLTNLWRHFSRGQSALMLAAYAMISVALVEFILFHLDLPPQRFYPVVLMLSLLLALNALWERMQQQWGSQRAHWIFLSLSAVLLLAINYLGLDEGWSFLPYLLFVVTSQAVVSLGIWPGIGFSLGLCLGWSGALWARGVPLTSIAAQIPSIALGMIFVLVFSIVLARLSQQMARAEQLAAELQAANAELAAARERELALAAAEERARLAHEIHDGLGHHLTALNVQLQAAARLLERDPARAAQALALCREEAQAALAEVRQSVALMRNTPIAGRSLPAAIAGLARDFDRVSPLQISFVAEGTIGEVSPQVAMTLYRAAQEGLTNAQKHGQASAVEVRLAGDDARLRLEVVNDGPPASSPTESGFGLAGLRERAAQLGGSLRAEPRAEGGFRLVIDIPRTVNEREGNSHDPGVAGR